MQCPYCDGEMEERDSSVIYNGKSYGPILLCSNFPECDARIGIRNGKPMGTPARHELRELRKACHARFDPLWKSGRMARSQAYQHLQQIMDLPKQEAHIALFREEQCRKLLALLEEQKEHE